MVANHAKILGLRDKKTNNQIAYQGFNAGKQISIAANKISPLGSCSGCCLK